MKTNKKTVNMSFEEADVVLKLISLHNTDELFAHGLSIMQIKILDENFYLKKEKGANE